MVHNYSKTSGKKQQKRPKTAHNFGGTTTDLPQCTFRDILNHIVNHKMYKQTDLKVLYVRLCHKYGEENMEELWD